MPVKKKNNFATLERVFPVGVSEEECPLEGSTSRGLPKLPLRRRFDGRRFGRAEAGNSRPLDSGCTAQARELFYEHCIS